MENQVLDYTYPMAISCWGSGGQEMANQHVVLNAAGLEYFIDLKNIEEIIDLSCLNKELTYSYNGNPMIRIHKVLIPLINLAQFDLSEYDKGQLLQGILVIALIDGDYKGLLVHSVSEVRGGSPAFL